VLLHEWHIKLQAIVCYSTVDALLTVQYAMFTLSSHGVCKLLLVDVKKNRFNFAARSSQQHGSALFSPCLCTARVATGEKPTDDEYRARAGTSLLFRQQCRFIWILLVVWHASALATVARLSNIYSWVTYLRKYAPIPVQK